MLYLLLSSNELSHSPSEESSIKSAEEEEVNSEEEFNVVSISGSDNEDPREDDEPGSAALSPMRRYSDARGVKKRNNATEEELEDAEKKANEMAAMKVCVKPGISSFHRIPTSK